MDAQDKVSIVAALILAVKGGHPVDAVALATSVLFDAENAIRLTDPDAWTPTFGKK